MPFQLMSNDIEVMADGIRDGLGIGRIFEPIRALQPDREVFLPVLEPWWKTYPGGVPVSSAACAEAAAGAGADRFSAGEAEGVIDTLQAHFPHRQPFSKFEYRS